jgi:hypothetical protein
MMLGLLFLIAYLVGLLIWQNIQRIRIDNRILKLEALIVMLFEKTYPDTVAAIKKKLDEENSH